jgi:SulP family sulfate permease
VGAVGLLRLGWIADLLSVPIITGFMVGVAFIITVHQLPDLLGAGAASGSTVHRIHTIFSDLHSTQGWAVAIGVAVLVLVVVCEKIDRRIPAALLGLVGSTLLVATANLGHRGVALLGPVATGLPKVGIPSVSWGDIGTVLPVSLTVAVVCLAQTAATVRGFSSDVDAKEMNHDFVALGAGNILSGFAGSFAVDASPARTSVVSNARGKTQAACLLAALVIAIASPAANELRRVPLATLAAILIFIASRLCRARDLKAIARFSKVELGLATITAVVVAFVGVEQGIALAVVLAIFDRARHSARPRMLELGRVPGTTSWTSLHTSERLETVPGVRVILFAGPLFFANAGEFRSHFEALVKQGGLPHAIVLDAAAMGDIDYTGAITLKAIVEDLTALKIVLLVARGGTTITDNLKQSGIFPHIGDSRVFETVDEAVRSVVVGGGGGGATPAPEATPAPGTTADHR